MPNADTRDSFDLRNSLIRIISSSSIYSKSKSITDMTNIPANERESAPLLNCRNHQPFQRCNFIYKEPTNLSSIKAIVCASHFNLLLIFVPLGIISHHACWPDSFVFCFNFLAIIPLANLLGFVTEEISFRLGATVGGLLNATFGNAVEFIISVVALKNGMIRVVQASILGSVLSNLLLVQGFCFFFGGLRYVEQSFNVTAAQTSSSLLALAVLSLLIPAAFTASTDDEYVIKQGLLNLSHGTALVLLVIYILYLIFQLRTHAHLYEDHEDDGEEPQCTLPVSFFALIIITVLVSICSDFLVASIEGFVTSLNISTTFVGIILIPIVGNAAEHASSVTFAIKNKMDLCIGIALGSSMQIALGVSPLLIILGWVIDSPLTLFFETFETCVLAISVLIVNYLIQDGKSNWLEGAMLLASYVIIALAFFFYPDRH